MGAMSISRLAGAHAAALRRRWPWPWSPCSGSPPVPRPPRPPPRRPGAPRPAAPDGSTRTQTGSATRRRRPGRSSRRTARCTGMPPLASSGQRRTRLHHAERPGQLRRPRRQAYQPGPRHDPGHRAEEPATGDPAGQPGWARCHGLPLTAEVAQGLNPAVAASYDIVGFDPRGVGSSRPALSCDPGFFSGVRPNYIPANAAAEQVLINRAKVRHRLRATVRLAAALYDHQEQRPATWTPSARRSACRK